MNDQLMIRCTTREQSLLDTLMRPISCGGSAVVFEAWEKAAADLDLPPLLKLLREINHALLSRRVGYMLENVRGDRGDSDMNLDALHEASHQGELAPLLPGMPYTRIDARWNLQVP